MKRILFILIVIMLILLDISYGRCNKNPKVDKPGNYYKIKDVLDTEIKYVLGKDFYLNYNYYIYSLIEHESCVSICSNRCYNVTSRLKTKREEGAGLLQITRTFRKNGTVRFDMLKEMKKRHRMSLKGLNWSNIYDRDMISKSIRCGLYIWEGNYRYFKRIKTIDDYNKLMFTDASYNGGLGIVRKRRKICKLKGWCDPRYWEDNVGEICIRKKKIYGNRRGCDIINHHVEDIFKNKIIKYIGD